VRDEDGTRWGPPISWFEAAGPAFLRSTATTSAEAFLDIMRERQPAYVATYPVALRVLAAVALERGGAMPLVRQFITSTEPVTAAMRALARRVFGARVTGRYSCEECGWLAHQCPVHDHYQALSANVVLEVVDDDGQACAPGQVGRVLVTALHSYAMPLIRYEVGDLAVLGDGCDCGITLPVLSGIEGREREFFVLPDGTRRRAAFNLPLHRVELTGRTGWRPRSSEAGGRWRPAIAIRVWNHRPTGRCASKSGMFRKGASTSLAARDGPVWVALRVNFPVYSAC
jgi:phenylacetate-CoA ligase